MDLKRYIDHGNQSGNPITLDIVKVRLCYLSCHNRMYGAWRIGSLVGVQSVLLMNISGTTLVISPRRMFRRYVIAD